MRNIQRSLVCVLFMVLFSVLTVDTGRAPQEGDFIYEVNDGGATITGYTGVGGDVSIPSTLGGYPTRAIENYTFEYFSNMISVMVPSSIVVIGEGAFSFCDSLVSVTFLGLTAPVVGADWILNTSMDIQGHAYAGSDFPAPGEFWNGLLMGAYIPVNDPPVFGASIPVNGSVNQLLSLTWSIPINDLEGDAYSWTIQCSNGQTSSGSGASNGTKSLVLSSLAYSTTYKVWVNATDPSPGSGLYTHRWYTFTTLALNLPPVFGASSLVNGSVNQLLSLTWSIPINDLEGDAYSWTIQCSNGQTNGGSGASNGTKSLALSGLAYLTMYKVWVNATDPAGSGLYTRGWYTFTTMSQPWVNHPPTLSNPSPANLSTGVSRFPMTSLMVGDLDGNATTVCFWYSLSNAPYSWIKAQQNNTVPANTNVRDRNSSYANAWNTTYWWKVTAYDGHVNVSIISRFTTTTSSWVNHAPVISTPSPSNGSLNVPRYWFTNITVSDADGNQTLTVCFWNNSTAAPGVWRKAQQNNSQSPLGQMVRDMNASWANAYVKKYWWKVTVSDGRTNVSRWYTFITESKSHTIPLLSNPQPTNGSTGVSLSPTTTITINTGGDDDPLTVTWYNNQTGSWITYGQISLVSSGTYSKQASWVTQYGEKYYWKVTVDDGTTTVTRWYWFTTKQNSGGGGTDPGEETVPEPVNKKPFANASAGAPYIGVIASEVVFDGGRSFDPDGTIATWEWDFGDNSTGTGQTIVHTYAYAGTYLVTLTVTDNENATDSDTTSCVISQPNRPPAIPIITGPIYGTRNTVYSYTVVATDLDNDTIRYSVIWGDGPSSVNTSAFVPSGTPFTCSHQWATAGRYLMAVTVTDNQTMSSTGQIIWINSINLTNLGYLMDSDGDGWYEVFHNTTTTQETFVGHTEETNLIDSNGDGKWEYTFDEVNGLTPYEETKTPGVDIRMEAGILLIAICGALLFGVLLRWKGLL